MKTITLALLILPAAALAQTQVGSETYYPYAPAGYELQHCGMYYCEAVSMNGGGAIITNAPTNTSATPPNCCGWLASPDPPEPAPEIDPGSAAAGLTLLAGLWAVAASMKHRRRHAEH